MILEAAILCLATNVYHEARGESFDGQVAVAQVTLNRAEHQQSKVCPTVYKAHQFSWTDEHPKPPHEGKEWHQAWMIAILTIHNIIPDKTNGATYYHAKRVDPWWRRSYRRTVTIGRHIFYRKK